MEQSVFSFSRLVPDFWVILSGELGTAHHFSASVVAFILSIAFSFFIFAVVKSWQASKQVKFYRALIQGVTQESLAEQQRDITQKALEHPKYGRLWKEFAETLVVSADGQKIFNTLDAGHFFNTHNLSYGLTENRLLAAVPGFLTAVGVLGTFAGLQMGLSGLELNKDSSVEVLQDGIGGMISGAAIAFMTSVWGVGSSVVFNFFEKVLERNVRSSISELERNVDYLYPRINAEQSLVSISETSKVSTETLQGLAEKIGDKMQEALVQVSGDIRTGLEDSLNQIMAPAIKALVDNAQNSSQELLDGVMDKFVESAGGLGDKQKEMMEEVSEQVNEAVSKLGLEMSGFAEHLQQQNSDNEQRDVQRAEVFSSQLGETLSISQQLTSDMTTNMNTRMEAQEQVDKERQRVFDESVSSLKDNEDVLIKRVEMLISYQQKSFSTIGDKIIELESKLSALLDSNADAASSMKDAANQLGVLSVNTKEAAVSLGGSIADAVTVTKEAANENVQSSKFNQELLVGMKELHSQIKQTSELMNAASKHANSSFITMEEHMKSFVSNLGDQVGELEKNVASLLDEYAVKVNSQTTNRMNEWNTHTSAYIGEMTRAVQSMSNVIDEIEGKVRAN